VRSLVLCDADGLRQRRRGAVRRGVPVRVEPVQQSDPSAWPAALRADAKALRALPLVVPLLPPEDCPAVRNSDPGRLPHRSETL
jgi:hypothetical protein